MTYEKAEQLLLSVSNLPRKEYMSDGKHEDAYLKRVLFFLDILGNPQKRIPHYIHIGGTSGKGSLVNILHAILLKDKKRVGSIISPHPTSLLERWRIDGTHMSKKEFVAMMELIVPALDIYARTTPYGYLSFFDLTTAIGLLYFAKKRVRYAVIEVGCGGAFDSTNVIPKKDIAIITTVGLDHTEILGKTKTAIAQTKAGIITPGSRVFTMETSARINHVLAHAAAKAGAPFTTVREQGTIRSETLSGTTFEYNEKTFSIRAIGAHQVKNAILAINIARAINVSERAIVAGLKSAAQPIRMEPVSKRPVIILDGAHNPDKIETTVNAMRRLIKKDKKSKLHLIIGYSSNKDTTSMIRALAGLKPDSVACTRNTINPLRKTADPAAMAAYAKKALPKAKIELFLDPKNALLWTKKHAHANDYILVTGSIFLAGEIRQLLRQT